MQNIYKVYRNGVYQCSFFERDAALDWVVVSVDEFGHDSNDYEILDGSDFPS